MTFREERWRASSQCFAKSSSISFLFLGLESSGLADLSGQLSFLAFIRAVVLKGYSY